MSSGEGSSASVTFKTFEDNYRNAVEYLEKYQILYIFEDITANLVYHRPDNPLQEISRQIQTLMQEKSQKS